MTMAKQKINNPIKKRTSLSKRLTADQEIVNILEFHVPTSRAGTRDEPRRTSALEARRHRTHHREFCS